MNKLNRFVATLFVLVPGYALAAVPADVSTALTDAKTDASSVAALVIVIVVAIAAFSFMRRAIK